MTTVGGTRRFKDAQDYLEHFIVQEQIDKYLPGGKHFIDDALINRELEKARSAPPDPARVREFDIEAFDGGKWTKVYSGSCIGHKHIACFPPVRAARLRLSVGKAAGRPAIREFSAWRVS